MRTRGAGWARLLHRGVFALLLSSFLIPAGLFLGGIPTAHASNGTIPCAIRWDAVDTGLGDPINTSITRTLSPARFWSRAPWYSVPQGPNSILIDGNKQSIMDQELAYAHDAGLTCWAYLWYGTGSSMQNAWHLQQASAVKNLVNWTQMQQFGNIHGSSDFASQTPDIISYFKQSNYQTVLGGRPLWFLYGDNYYGSQLSAYWGNSTSAFASALATFRGAVQAAGLPNPYVVMVNGSATVAASLGADAVTSYIPSFGAPAVANPWSNVAATISAYWTSLGNSAAISGIKTVPIAATGWDTRPRKQNIVNWNGGSTAGKPYAGLNVYNVLPTPAELTTELQNAVSYVAANPALADSKVVFIYAWNECDEGGNCLIPHYNPLSPGTPDTSILDALSAVNW